MVSFNIFISPTFFFRLIQAWFFFLPPHFCRTFIGSDGVSVRTYIMSHSSHLFLMLAAVLAQNPEFSKGALW